MASEDIGSLYPTKVPGYNDAADIQAALRMYHYGDTAYNIQNTDPNNLQPNSIAGSFNSLNGRVTTLEGKHSPVSVSATEPTSPTDGYIWINTNESSISGGAFGNMIDYSETAPTSFLAHGRLWAKLGTNPIQLYIRNNTTSTWDRLI